MDVIDIDHQREDPACPLCGTRVRETLYRSARQAGLAAVTVVQCAACGFLYSAPRLKAAALERFYAESQLASGQVFRDESASGVYPRLFAQRARFLADALAGRPGGSLLDVGCGGGGFLRALRDLPLAGWQLRGLEPSHKAAASCREHGLEVLCSGFAEADFPPASLDVVSLVSVLEHLPDPQSCLQWCRRTLRDDGLLFIEVPDNLQPELSLSSHFCAEHLIHFSPWTLGCMLAASGFRVLARAADARGVIRLVAGAGVDAGAPPDADDRAAVRQAIVAYADAEQRLVAAVRTRVEVALIRWRAAGLRVAIYGAGVHSVHLAELVDLPGNAHCFIDGDPGKQGGSFLGLPVHAPEQLRALGIGAVLISSNRFIEEMAARVRAVGGADIIVAGCYEETSESGLPGETR